MKIKPIILVIADITGYTDFIKANKASMLHAEEIISELIETVIEKADYPLELNKLEGDAVLMYADTRGNWVEAGQEVMAQVKDFFGVFHQRIETIAEERKNCSCEACKRVVDLHLKVVVHNGDVIRKQIRQFEELAGEAVIIAHRLLKNGVTAPDYILMSEQFYQAAELESIKELESREEIYQGLGTIKTRVWGMVHN